MLGALIKATGVLDVEDIMEPLLERFGPELRDKNMRALMRAYAEAKLKE
jgi:pyruvate ferredoxin oxidoreductase gamma subunit